MTSINYTDSQVKGRRLRMARALTGLSRQEFHEKTGIATSTMDTWESGRVELNDRSAHRLCDSFCSLGVFCSPDWLLSGSGAPPYIMSKQSEDSQKNKSQTEIDKTLLKLPPFLDTEIKKELSFFLNLHEHALFHIIRKKFLLSIFEIGDCVAGDVEDPKNLVGETIILQDAFNELHLCKLKAVNENIAEVFFTSKKLDEKIEFKKMARVIWHRKPKNKPLKTNNSSLI